VESEALSLLLSLSLSLSLSICAARLLGVIVQRFFARAC
jgi:hypothetical protein